MERRVPSPHNADYLQWKGPAHVDMHALGFVLPRLDLPAGRDRRTFIFIYLMGVRYQQILSTKHMPYNRSTMSARSLAASSFKMDLQAFVSEPSVLESCVWMGRSLKQDLFPYLQSMSLCSFLITFQITIYAFLDASFTIIKPFKGTRDFLPWLLAPFTVHTDSHPTHPIEINLSQLSCHVVFIMFVIAELEHKLQNTGKLLLIYISSVLLPNLLLQLLLAPHDALSCNNSSTYSLYGYLLLLDHRQSSARKTHSIEVQYDSQFSYRDQSETTAGQDKEDRITGLYKFVVLTYLVFLAGYGEGCPFVSYLIALGCISVAALLELI